jgi:hypothetical protein
MTSIKSTLKVHYYLENSKNIISKIIYQDRQLPVNNYGLKVKELHPNQNSKGISEN